MDTPKTWQQGGGDLRAAVDALAGSGRPGALLRMDVEGTASSIDDDLLRRAWEKTVATLPTTAIGKRTAWSRFELVVEGDRATLGALGARLLTALKRDDALAALEWHLVFVEIFGAEPERTFLCDPGYDLRAAAGKSAVAFVQPYPGSDWREPRRYPTVAFFPLDDRA